MSGGIYPPPSVGLSVRTCDPQPRADGRRRFIVASAETLAYAVASGQIGDPRSFKRPVRVTVPRALPTDDVLVLRDRRAGELTAKRPSVPAAEPLPVWKGPQTLEIVEGAGFDEQAVRLATRAGGGANGKAHLAVVCGTLDEVRQLALWAVDVAPSVRAVLAPFIPSGLVAVFSGAGIAAIQVDAAAAKGLRGQKSLVLPAPGQWAEGNATSIPLGAGKVAMTWLALGAERAWTSAGTARAMGAGAKA
jgi:hypothetical protein